MYMDLLKVNIICFISIINESVLDFFLARVSSVRLVNLSGVKLKIVMVVTFAESLIFSEILADHIS